MKLLSRSIFRCVGEMESSANSRIRRVGPESEMSEGEVVLEKMR